MEKLVIFCKSYLKDLYRAKRMAESVNRFNSDNILLYLSVPSTDLKAFKQNFEDIPCIFLTDEDVLTRCYEAYGPPPKLFPKYLIQQLIKMEFWRLGVCEHYLWIDSDSYFLNPFSFNTFFNDDGKPFLVMHKATELRAFGKKHDTQIIHNLDSLIKSIQQLFGRQGEGYYFGEPPLLWSCTVLESMHKDYLSKNEMSIFELLYKYPCEMQLYGEYCLASKAHPVFPVEPYFKVFHYLEQFCEAQRNGESDYRLSKNYLGVVMQSNWTNAKEKKKNDMARFKKFLREQQRKLGLIRW